MSAFLEVDRGTMPNLRFQEKIEHYFAYDVSGRYSERFGGKRFRIIVATKTQERLENLERTAAQVAQRYCWLATLPELGQSGPLAAIWSVVGREGKVAPFEPPSKEGHAQ